MTGGACEMKRGVNVTRTLAERGDRVVCVVLVFQLNVLIDSTAVWRRGDGSRAFAVDTSCI